MNNIEKLQNIFKELRKDDEEGHSSAYELQWEDISTIENLIIENKKLIQENKELKEHLEKYYNGELFTAKQLKSIEENQKKYFIYKSKVKELAKKYEFALNGYDSSTADYKHSQNLGKYLACVELLEEGDK